MIFAEEIYGNERQKEYYKNAVLSGNLHHANIIAGNTGSGRHTFVRCIIKALACENDKKRPCGICDNCVRIDRDAAPDIFYVKKPDDKTTVLFEQIREIIPYISKTPHLFDFTAVIIDADNIEARTQNALLKILEEPPSYVYFFIVVRDLSSLLPTVISRCHTEYMQNFDDDGIKEYLTHENPYIDGEKLDFAVKIAGGTIGKAKEMLSGDVNDEIKAYVFVKDTLNMLFDKNVSETDFILAFSSFSSKREDFIKTIPYFLSAFTELLLIKESRSVTPIFFDGDLSENTAAAVSSDAIVKMKDIILVFSEYLKANAILKNAAVLSAAKLYKLK